MHPANAVGRQRRDAAHYRHGLLHSHRANVFSPFVALSHLPETIATGVTGLAFGTYGTLLVILLGYVVLGMFIEGLSLLSLRCRLSFR